MTAVKPEEKLILSDKSSLFKDYPWYYSNFYLELKKSLEEFFQKKFDVRFMGISSDENILFYGDEYFVNKIPVTKNGDFKVRLSSKIIECMLNNALGLDEKPFELKKLTDIEAGVIKSYIVYLSLFFCIENSKKTLKKQKQIKKLFKIVKNAVLHFS